MAATNQSAVDESLIHIQKMRVDYGSKVAVCGVDLQIAKNKVTAIVGPSGSGKSTVLLAMNRLLESVSAAKITGRIEYDGNDIFSRSTKLATLRRRMGTVFQRPTVFPVSIFDNIAIPLKEMGPFKKTEIVAMTENVLRRVGLWDEVKDRLNQSALGLSGGQMQRLCLARALVLNPEVLLLDEPCSALDPMASRKIEELILSLRGEKTIVIVTHNLAQARRLSDYVALFWPCAPVNCAGTILEFSDSKTFFNSPRESITREYVSGVLG